MALPRASTKRSRILPEVFDDCSSVGRRQSPRDRAIIREVNETVFALNFLETGGIGCLSHVKKWGTPHCPLLARRAIEGYSLTCDDTAPGSLTVFRSSRVARPQDASKAPYLVSLLSSSARSYLDAHKQRMLRAVSEVAYMETRLGLAGRCVDPVFQPSRRHYLVKAGSVGFVEEAVEQGGPFVLAKKAGA